MWTALAVLAGLVAVLSLGSAALGIGIHHRRFVGYHRFKGLPAPETSLLRWLLADVRAFSILGWWHVRGFLRDGLRTPDPTCGRPVLCVHGYTQNATNFHGLRTALERAGRPTVAVSLWHRLAPMSWYRRRLERKLDELLGAFPDGIDIVAHSMGGVVLRAVLTARADLRSRIHTVVTLGTPHRGTAAARGIPLVPEVLALKRRSVWLADLPQLTELLPHARVVAIAGDADTVVYPVESVLMPGAESVVLHGVTHAGLLTTAAARAAVVAVLAAS